MNSIAAGSVSPAWLILLRPVRLGFAVRVGIPPNHAVKGDEGAVRAARKEAGHGLGRFPRFIGRNDDAHRPRMMQDPVKAGRPTNNIIVQEKLPLLVHGDRIGSAGLGCWGDSCARQTGAEENLEKTCHGLMFWRGGDLNGCCIHCRLATAFGSRTGRHPPFRRAAEPVFRANFRASRHC